MKRLVAKLTTALIFAVCASALPAAAQSQARQEADAAHKEALRTLIAEAEKEGSVSYWDTIIQSVRQCQTGSGVSSVLWIASQLYGQLQLGEY